MRANGYGADLEFVDGFITIHAGKMAARLQHTALLRFPVSDVTEVMYRPANFAVNGVMQFRVSGDVQSYGADQPNTANSQSLVVHWRRKDEAEFAALRDAIDGARV